MFAKFSKDQKSITISSIKYLNFNFYSLKLCTKKEFINEIVIKSDGQEI